MAVKAVRTMSIAGEICHSPAISWSPDNRISLVIDDGIHIMEPILNSQDLTPFSCRRSFIPNCSEPLIFEVECNRSEIARNANRDIVTRMMLDRTLCADTANIRKCKGFRSACWSPHSPFKTYKSILASLSVDHRLMLHTENNYVWSDVEDLSQKLNFESKKSKFNFCQVDSTEVDKYSREFHKLKTRTHFLSAVEMLWTQHFSYQGQDFSFLIVAMKSGHLVFWKIMLPCKSKNNVSIGLICDTDLGLISSLAWQQTTKNEGILIVGSHSGQIKMISMSISEATINMNDAVMLWDEEDMMSVKCIAIGWQNGNHVVVCGKSHYIVSTMITAKGSLVRQAVSEGIHTLPLTNICSLINGWFLACSMDFNIYKFQVDAVGEEITLMEEIVAFDVPTNGLLPHGIIQSPNAVFCCLIQKMASFYDHLIHKEPIKINFFINQEEDAIWTNLLMSKKLFSHCKDIQEFIRVRLHFENGLPKIMTDILDADEAFLQQQSLFVLKLCRFILERQMSQTANEEFENKKYQFSIVSNIILHKHALNVVHSVQSQTHFKNLSSQKLLSLFIMTEWLRSGASKVPLTEPDQLIVGDVLAKVNYELPPSEQEEKCSICKEIIPFGNVNDGGCCNGHIFGRCCHTMLVCNSFNYKKCPICNCLVMTEYYWNPEFICTFCDEIVA